MNNISFGKYVPTNSIIHRINPTIKMIFLILMMIALFIMRIPNELSTPSFIALGSMLFLVLLLIVISKIPLLKVLKSVSVVFFLILFTGAIQILSNQGGVLLTTFDFHFSYWCLILIVGALALYILISKYIRFKFLLLLLFVVMIFVFQYFVNDGTWVNYTISIYSNALVRASFLVFRVIIIVLLSSLLTSTTSILELNNGIGTLLSPLRLIKIKTDNITMMLSLVIRLIPSLLEETQKVIIAQSARGADLYSSNFFKKIKIIVSLLIPIFVISIKKGDELADALIVRGYELNVRRTSIDGYKIRFIDFIWLFLSILLVISAITLRVLGYI